jgi:hypothetical protein
MAICVPMVSQPRGALVDDYLFIEIGKQQPTYAVRIVLRSTLRDDPHGADRTGYVPLVRNRFLRYTSLGDV